MVCSYSPCSRLKAPAEHWFDSQLGHLQSAAATRACAKQCRKRAAMWSFTLQNLHSGTGTVPTGASVLVTSRTFQRIHGSLDHVATPEPIGHIPARICRGGARTCWLASTRRVRSARLLLVIGNKVLSY